MGTLTSPSASFRSVGRQSEGTFGSNWTTAMRMTLRLTLSRVLSSLEGVRRTAVSRAAVVHECKMLAGAVVNRSGE